LPRNCAIERSEAGGGFDGVLPSALARHHSTRKEASRNIFAYIEGFYHRTRRHPAVGDIGPIEMALKAA
jgi:transposase InsO family protein